MTKKEISDFIEDTLGFTNGWRISDEDYKMHCDDIADRIVKNCSIPNVVGQSEQLKDFAEFSQDNYSFEIPDRIIKDYEQSL